MPHFSHCTSANNLIKSPSARIHSKGHWKCLENLSRLGRHWKGTVVFLAGERILQAKYLYVSIALNKPSFLCKCHITLSCSSCSTLVAGLSKTQFVRISYFVVLSYLRNGRCAICDLLQYSGSICRTNSTICRPQRHSTAVLCSIPPSAFQAAERRASSLTCSTSDRCA